jgi:hypothetical protein
MQNDFHVHLDLSVPRRTLTILLASAILITVTPEIGSENVTLSTYYPAPSGVYTRMITTSNAYLATNGGSVGIGTTSPAYKLHVAGGGAYVAGSGGSNIDLRVTGRMMTGDGGNAGGVWLNGTNTMFVGQSGTNVGFWTNGAWRFLVSQAGSIGIGATPGAAGPYLYINGTTGCAAITCGTNAACACAGYVAWTPGLRIEGASYQNRGYPAYVNVAGGNSNQVWALNTTNGQYNWGTLTTQSSGPGTIWCCAK